MYVRTFVKYSQVILHAIDTICFASNISKAMPPQPFPRNVKLCSIVLGITQPCQL